MYEDYVVKQSLLLEEYFLNFTTHEDFVLAITNDTMAKNEYYDLYFDHQVKDLYRKQSGHSGVDTTEYPVPPVPDGRRLSTLVTPIDRPVDLSNRRFRL